MVRAGVGRDGVGHAVADERDGGASLTDQMLHIRRQAEAGPGIHGFVRGPGRHHDLVVGVADGEDVVAAGAALQRIASIQAG